MPESSLEHLVHDAFYHAFEPHSESFCIPQGDVFDDVTCEFGMPVPSVRGMRGYGPDPSRYLQAGKINTERMLELVTMAGKAVTNQDRILDSAAVPDFEQAAYEHHAYGYQSAVILKERDLS